MQPRLLQVRTGAGSDGNGEAEQVRKEDQGEVDGWGPGLRRAAG